MATSLAGIEGVSGLNSVLAALCVGSEFMLWGGLWPGTAGADDSKQEPYVCVQAAYVPLNQFHQPPPPI